MLRWGGGKDYCHTRRCRADSGAGHGRATQRKTSAVPLPGTPSDRLKVGHEGLVRHQLVQLVAELVFQGRVQSADSVLSRKLLRVPSARARWLFTVPSLQPSTAAVSRSLIPSR